MILEPVKGSQKPFPFSGKDFWKGLDVHTAHADELAEVSEKEMGG